MTFDLCKNGHYFDPSKAGGCPFCTPEDAAKPTVLTAARMPLPVGWFVVVEGPNCGADFTIYEGENAVGRSPNPIALDTDSSVRTDQVSAIYDSRGNRFLLRPGSAGERARLNGVAVESKMGMGPGDRLVVGKTTLLFIPLAGDRFQWPTETPI